MGSPIDHLERLPHRVHIEHGIAASWDTLGWILFREGKSAEAESYLKASWIAEENPETNKHPSEAASVQGHKLQLDGARKLALGGAEGGAAGSCGSEFSGFCGSGGKSSSAMIYGSIIGVLRVLRKGIGDRVWGGLEGDG